ncbi:MAG: hypothetical protein NC412_14825 [Roseburia sp.]|nr:hypothetical protein [Roseburia sp.]MCM1280053.1 hypothetical protein [Robinsoniella sp.]
MLQYMEIRQGYSYHIKDEFFDMVQDKYLMSNKENAFLIQNAFPVIEKFFDYIHTVENKPVTVHNELNRILTENLREAFALHNRGINLLYTDIEKIRMVMEQKLKNIECL